REIAVAFLTKLPMNATTCSRLTRLIRPSISKNWGKNIDSTYQYRIMLICQEAVFGSEKNW
ncbi:MAG: hypothetical protein ACRC8Y_17245, partial [Chroococcales cyanobacterium]